MHNQLWSLQWLHPRLTIERPPPPGHSASVSALAEQDKEPSA